MTGGQRAVVTCAAVAALLLLPGARLQALINPNFTPVHLTRQSEVILQLRFGVPGEKGVPATVVHVLKGKTDAKTLTFVLDTSAYAEQTKSLARLITEWGDRPVLLFTGRFARGDDEGGMGGGPEQPPGGDQEQKAFLHIGGIWVTFYAAEAPGTWEMDALNQKMLGTWQGSTDMLLRAVEYILKEEDADVPARTFANWGGQNRFDTLTGRVYQARSVDLRGDGTLVLHLAAEKGDRLYRHDAKDRNLRDVTDECRLKSTSVLSLWGDFNADGSLDLLSWNGKEISIHAQQADSAIAADAALAATAGKDGTFSALEVKNAREIPMGGAVGLDIVDRGKPGEPGVIVSTGGSPLLWVPRTGAVEELRGKDVDVKDLGAPGKCLVADFDGDALPDVLQPFENGGLLYKGRAPGSFDPPRRTLVALGKGQSGAFQGDFDADGVLDVFAAAEDGCRIWHNFGNAQFTEMLSLSGEIGYISKGGGIGGQTGDINNDGRQDVLILYSAMSPHLFFNRGFRSFGHSHMLDLAENRFLPQANDGQQAGCLGDFNGDGAQDMAIVLTNGEGWVFYREARNGAALSVRGVLSPKSPSPGPLTVTGWRRDRCLGAWNVVAGTGEAFVGQLEAGPVTLKWTLPGGKTQSREILLIDRPVRWVIP